MDEQENTHISTERSATCRLSRDLNDAAASYVLGLPSHRRRQGLDEPGYVNLEHGSPYRRLAYNDGKVACHLFPRRPATDSVV